MRISDWSSDVCSSDLLIEAGATFDGDYANVTGYTVPGGGIDYNGDFVKVEGTWVRAVDVAATGQEVVVDDGTTKWGVETGAAGDPATNITETQSIATMALAPLTHTTMDTLISPVDARTQAREGKRW